MSTEAMAEMTACKKCGQTLHNNGIGGPGLSIGEVGSLAALMSPEREPVTIRSRAKIAPLVGRLESIAACGPADAPLGKPLVFCRDCRSRFGEWSDFSDGAVFISPTYASRLLHFLKPRRGRPTREELDERTRLLLELTTVYVCATDIHMDAKLPTIPGTDPFATGWLS